METISIGDQPYRASDLSGKVVSINDPSLVEIVRIRYVSDPGFPMWDCSYIWGLDNEGDVVRVNIPPAIGQIPKPRPASTILKRCRGITKLIPSGFVLDILSLHQ